MESDEDRRAFAAALKILSLRDQSEAELCRKLTCRGYSHQAIENSVVRMKDLGYLNDRRFAENFAAAAKRGGKAFGWRLKMELSRRGVAGELIEELLAAETDETDQLAALSQLMSRRFSWYDPAAASDKEKKRILDYCQRRGFDRRLVMQLLHGVAEEKY